LVTDGVRRQRFNDLESRHFDSFVVFVCGDDGLVTLEVGDLHKIVGFEQSENAWVRIDRKPHSQYAVSGNRAELERKTANGISLVHDTIVKNLRELRSS
jgi:hypothetical protein